MKISTWSRSGFVVAATAALTVAGCGGSKNDELPLIRATVSVKTVSFGGTCETVPVRMTPKALSGEANKYANDSMMVLEVATTGPTDEGGAPMCNGTAETLPMAPGTWEFSAPLRSDTYKCERDIQVGGDLQIAFVDGVEGCGGPAATAEPSEETTGMPGPDEEKAAEGEAAPAAPAPAGGAPAANGGRGTRSKHRGGRHGGPCRPFCVLRGPGAGPVAEEFPQSLRAAFGLLGRIAPRLAARLAAELMTRPRGRNPPQPWELAPATLASREIVLPGGLRALCWGESGPIVLAQHGWRGRPTQFRRFAEALVPAGLRLVATDAPGHGRSPGARATPRLLADGLVAAAGALGEVRGIVGHSLGGAAAALALEFGLPARRLVMIGSPSRPSRMISAFAGSIGLPPNARAALDRWFEAHAGRAVGDLDPLNLRFGPDVEAMVVHDRDDDVIPVAEAELLEAAWPGAHFLYTTGLGHRDLLADATVVARVAAFLVAGSGATRNPR